jgi:HTH-type transcriptional regulator/antitoxin HigA
MESGPMEPTSPQFAGDVIRELLGQRGWTQADLARVLGRSASTVNEIIQGKQLINPELAISLGAAFGNSPQFWMTLEANRQLAGTSTPADDVRRRANLFEIAPVKDMERRGWIRRTTTATELEAELRRFFAQDDLTKIPSFPVSARRVSAMDDLTPAQRAWCFRARALAAEQVVTRFNSDKLDDCTAKLRVLAAFAPEARKVAALLSKYGIRFVIVEPLTGAKIDGAAFWVGDDSPAIAVSLRHDRIDAFWFTLCHEISHIRHRDPLSVDTALVGDDAEPTAVKVAFERRADDEAGNMLIPKDKLQSFIHRVAPLYSKERIIQFAHRVKIHPGIIVGQLQHRGEIGYHANREMLAKVRETAISGAIVDGWGHSPN